MPGVNQRVPTGTPQTSITVLTIGLGPANSFLGHTPLSPSFLCVKCMCVDSGLRSCACEVLQL